LNKASTIKAQAQKYLSSGNFDKALEEYEKLLSMEDVDPYDFVLAGDVHLKKGDTARAVSLYEKALDSYAKLGLYKNAVAIGKRALRLDPGLSDMYRQLGRIKLHEGLAAEALQDFTRYYEIKLKEGDLESAIAGLELACKASPHDQELSEKLYSLHWQTKNTADAAKELARISGVMRDRGDQEKAAEYYERALKINSEALSMPAVEEEKHQEGPVSDATVEHGAGPLTGPSRPPAEPDRSLRPTSHEATTRDASVLATSEEIAGASASVRDKPRRRVSDVNVSQILKQFKSQMENKVGPDDYQCHYDLGMTYKEMGLHEEALNELRVASASEQFRVKAFELAGLCHLEIGEYEEATEAFNRAIKERSQKDTDYPGLCFNLGSALEAMGRTEEALKRFQEVESLNPHFPGLKEKLEALQSKAAEEH
jgi:tetratricopeptide (TPR) repeat protein